MVITGIHGAFSTPNAFNYITLNSKHVWKFVDYSDKKIGIEDIIDELNKKINQDTIIVGHSLGGVMGCMLLENKHVKGVITIASPLGGIYINRFIAVYMAKNFVSEMKQNGKIVKRVQEVIDSTDKQVYNIVTSKGYNPFLVNPNDGVIEISSQVMSPHQKVYIPAGHNEVMTTPELVRTLDICLEKIKG